MDVDRSPLLESPVRDWSELPLDPLSLIFMKLGAIEVLMGAGLVCRSWLAAAKAPEIWRFVDMTRHKLVFSKGTDTLCAMARVAINRSDGRMESFWAQQFVTDELLDYIGNRANSLRSIRLVACTHFWHIPLVKMLDKCPLLEEVECSYQRMTDDFFRYLGVVCPQLKRLRIHLEREWYDSDAIRREMEMESRRQNGDIDEDEESEEETAEAWEARQNVVAFVIAEGLPELRLLQMAGNRLTNKGLYAILEGCPHLECLDISDCFNLRFNDELRARCSNLKHVLFHKQQNKVCCPDLHVIGEKEGEERQSSCYFFQKRKRG